MTDQQILELTNEYLEEWEVDEDGRTAEKIIQFAQAIRRDALYEAIYLLSNVPNPEVNRTAINRITMELD